MVGEMPAQHATQFNEQLIHAFNRKDYSDIAKHRLRHAILTSGTHTSMLVTQHMHIQTHTGLPHLAPVIARITQETSVVEKV